MKVILSILLCLTLCVQPVMAAENTDENMETEESETPEAAEGEDAQEKETQQQEIEISAPSAILMEASTGQVIFEKNPDEQRPPASVTKIMTLLLIFDALESGQISLEDEVTTSEHAASMGGSQVFLEPGEIQTVDTLIKCIAVASGNDACVAMAEYIDHYISTDPGLCYDLDGKYYTQYTEGNIRIWPDKYE